MSIPLDVILKNACIRSKLGLPARQYRDIGEFITDESARLDCLTWQRNEELPYNDWLIWKEERNKPKKKVKVTIKQSSKLMELLSNPPIG